MVIKLEEVENVATTVEETSLHPQPMSTECLWFLFILELRHTKWIQLLDSVRSKQVQFDF